jgi:tetratricopeptide (TPR) repeat protein
MRNGEGRTFGAISILGGGVLVGLLGCGPDPGSKARLDAGYQALERRDYDSAMVRAEDHLRADPNGAGSAEAHYLRGRAYEQRTASSPAEAASNLARARQSYLQALALNPPRKLQTSIRASLGNVAYFADDYATAAAEFAAVLKMNPEPEVRMWSLYRLGLCQQRLGQFEQADQTFAKVVELFPTSEPARRAREKHGARAFRVQVATFANSTTADQAARTMFTEGVPLTTQRDAQGRTVLLSNPIPSHAQARALRDRLADRFPDALIVP